MELTVQNVLTDSIANEQSTRNRPKIFAAAGCSVGSVLHLQLRRADGEGAIAAATGNGVQGIALEASAGAAAVPSAASGRYDSCDGRGRGGMLSSCRARDRRRLRRFHRLS